MSGAAAPPIYSPETRYDERLPENEIYGRSFSTVHRLGAFMVGRVAAETIHSPEADQVRVEFYTSVEEGFGTDEKLGADLEVRDFDMRPVIDGKVMSKDLKTAVSDMTCAGLICAEKKARGDKHFQPQLVRSRWDHNNALIVDKMARGETDYNTRIVISPFPEEAAAVSGDEYWQNIGYVPRLKRGFVQLYHVDSNGENVSGSLSFNGSNKQKLRNIFARYGVDIPEDEVTDNWLKYAITDNLSTDQAQRLATEIADLADNSTKNKSANTIDVTRENRAIMDRVFDESYVHACESLARGYQTQGARNLIMQLANKAGHYNERYQKALYGMRANQSRFTDDDMAVIHDLLVYSAIEVMRAIHLKKIESRIARGKTSISSLNVTQLRSLDVQAFQSALGGFGADGAKNNRTYSACGLAIMPGGEGDGIMGPQAVFGGVDSRVCAKEVKNGQEVHCPYCNENVKAIVESPDKTIECSNPDCDMAAAKVKRSILQLFATAA